MIQDLVLLVQNQRTYLFLLESLYNIIQWIKYVLIFFLPHFLPHLLQFPHYYSLWILEHSSKKKSSELIKCVSKFKDPPMIIPISSFVKLVYTLLYSSWFLQASFGTVIEYLTGKKFFHATIIASVFLHFSLRVSLSHSQSRLNFYVAFLSFFFLLVSKPQYNDKVLSAHLSWYLLPLTTSKLHFRGAIAMALTPPPSPMRC